MPHITILECLTLVFTLTVLKCGMAQPKSKEHGADVYQLARTSAMPNALIEITNLLSVPMVLQKKDLQFHGHTPLRSAPWNIDPMNVDAFLVSPIWYNKTGTYLSIYGAMVYEIREDARTIAFALYFSVPDGHARHRFPWFGLEIYANDFERLMRDALEADYTPGGGVTTLNTHYRRFSYAKAYKTLRVLNSDYKIIANMEMTSSTTATIKVSVQPARTYRGAPRTPAISQPAPPEPLPILKSTGAPVPSSASTDKLEDANLTSTSSAALVEDLSSSSDASTHASAAQSQTSSTTEQSSTPQVTEGGAAITDAVETVSSSVPSEATTTAPSSEKISSTISQVQDDDTTVSTLGSASTTQETTSTTEATTLEESSSSSSLTHEHEDSTSTTTENVSSPESVQESTTIMQTSSTTTVRIDDSTSTTIMQTSSTTTVRIDDSTSTTTEAVEPTTTTTISTIIDEIPIDCDYDCLPAPAPA